MCLSDKEFCQKQKNCDIPNLVSNTQSVYNYEQLAYTAETSKLFITVDTTNIISVSFLLPIPLHFRLLLLV